VERTRAMRNGTHAPAQQVEASAHKPGDSTPQCLDEIAFTTLAVDAAARVRMLKLLRLCDGCLEVRPAAM
jgi:hypothetical protein